MRFSLIFLLVLAYCLFATSMAGRRRRFHGRGWGGSGWGGGWGKRRIGFGRRPFFGGSSSSSSGGGFGHHGYGHGFRGYYPVAHHKFIQTPIPVPIPYPVAVGGGGGGGTDIVVINSSDGD